MSSNPDRFDDLIDVKETGKSEVEETDITLEEVLQTVQHEHQQTREEANEGLELERLQTEIEQLEERNQDLGDRLEESTKQREELRERLDRYQTSVPLSVWAGAPAGGLLAAYGIFASSHSFTVVGVSVIFIVAASIYEAKVNSARLR